MSNSSRPLPPPGREPVFCAGYDCEVSEIYRFNGGNGGPKLATNEHQQEPQVRQFRESGHTPTPAEQ